MSRERILVAMSGGVDSSVAALLLKQQGHDIVGAYMKNWINEDNVIGDCPWMQDIDDARATAEAIGIEFRVVNLMQDYRRLVVFARYAKAEGFAAVATGHYAQRRETTPGKFGLVEGADKNKDQSYFLALLAQAQLRDARFPIGHLQKPELREIAAAAKLPNSRKKDSQGICFIGEVKMADFLTAYVPPRPGPIVRATDEKVVGEHRGLHYYTIGQRRGIRIPSNTDHEAYVVVGKRARDHALLVAFDGPQAPGLWTSECRVHSLSFIGEPITTAQKIECRVRYRDPRVAIEFAPVAGVADPGPGSASPATTAHIKFDTPQRALAAGQIMALYRGEELLGGAVFA